MKDKVKQLVEKYIESSKQISSILDDLEKVFDSPNPLLDAIFTMQTNYGKVIGDFLNITNMDYYMVWYEFEGEFGKKPLEYEIEGNKGTITDTDSFVEFLIKMKEE